MKKIISLVDKGIKSKDCGEFLDVIREMRDISSDLVARMVEAKMESDIVAILGREKHKRYVGKPYKAGVCQQCGEVLFNTEIVRNGHRRINVELEYGQKEIAVPRIIHKGDCKGSIETKFGIFGGGKRKRSLIEVDRNMIASYLEGVGHRGVGRIEGHRNNTNYSAMKSWNILQQTAEIMPELDMPLEEEMVLFGDEISIRLREIIKDKKSKKEEIFGLQLMSFGKGKKFTQIVALEIVKHRTKEEWIKVFEKLKTRGLKRIKLLVRDGSTIIEEAAREVLDVIDVQECHFHRLKSIFDDLKRKLNRDEITEEKYKQATKEIYKVFRSKTPQQARERLAKINDAEIFNKLSDKFEALFGNLGKKDIFYTNNTVERAIKDVKRRIKPMESFKTYSGAKNFAKMFLYKEYFRKEKKDWIGETFSRISLDVKTKLKELNEALGQKYEQVEGVLNWEMFEKGLSQAFRAMNTSTYTGEMFRRIIREKHFSEMSYKFQKL